MGALSFLSRVEFSRWVLKTRHNAQLKKYVNIQLIRLVSPRRYWKGTRPLALLHIGDHFRRLKFP